VIRYLNEKDNFGMRIEISREDILLDTGGGLKKAAWFFLEGGAQPQEPFLLHNVDVISTIDLGQMLQFHREHQALATLAVQQRETSRYLLFDTEDQLCGRRTGTEGASETVRPPGPTRALAFSGVHIISPRLFSMLTEDGAFPIISAYLRLASQGERIVGFRADRYYWRDLGRPENIEQAARDVQLQVVPV